MNFITVFVDHGIVCTIPNNWSENNLCRILTILPILTVSYQTLILSQQLRGDPSVKCFTAGFFHQILLRVSFFTFHKGSFFRSFSINYNTHSFISCANIFLLVIQSVYFELITFYFLQTKNSSAAYLSSFVFFFFFFLLMKFFSVYLF